MKKIVAIILTLTIFSMMTFSDFCSVSAQELTVSQPAIDTTQPATSKPTTSEPTTFEPTTFEPTTFEPTTFEPTTSEPTTSEPTTSEPTTSELTTSELTTSEPTTSEPTTSEPTTSEPATSEPTTSEPTMSEPTMSEPTTSEPTTSEPMTSKPTEKILLGEELYNYIIGLDEKAQEAYIKTLTKEQIDSLNKWLGESENAEKPTDKPNKNEESAAGFTDVGPFLPPVIGKGRTLLKSFALNNKTKQNVDTDGLILNKSISKQEQDGKYTLNLEAYVDGKVTSSTVTKDIPTDIVLVLDQSGSMKDGFGESVSCINALKQTLTNFVNSVHNKALGEDKIKSDDDIDHRVAMVGFADKGSSYNNTEILTPTVKKYNELINSDYKNALVKVNDDNGTVNSCITHAIGNIDADGGTYVQYGLEMARKILTNNPVPSGQKRNQVVIVFTDGYPGDGKTSIDTFGTLKNNISTANDAISESKVIKNMGATVYTIGVFSGSNPTSEIDFQIHKIGGIIWYNPANVAANAYMHFMSSNYEDATSMIEPGERTSGENNYYLSAKDQTDLDNIFESISENIQNPEPIIQLGADTVLKDILTDYFKVTSKDDIKVYTSNYKGKDTSGKMVWDINHQPYNANINVIEKTVEVSGFDFSGNFVADITSNENDTPRGNKLIIKIPIELEDNSTFGGANIPTNEESSGVYKEDKLIENFIRPTVNIPIRYGFVTEDKYDFISNKVDIKDILTKASGFVADGSNNDFVNINYSIKDGNNEIATFSIPAGKTYNEGIWSDNTTVLLNDNKDKNITIDCVVTAVSDTNMKWSKSKSSKVYVYLPILNCRDTTVDYGDTVHLSESVSAPQWSASDNKDPTADELSSAPKLNLTYAHMEDNNKEYTDSYIVEEGNNFLIKSVMANAVEIKPYVTIIKSTCTEGEHLQNRDFTIHYHKYDLIIQKNGANANLDPNQTFIFSVMGGPDNLNLKVAIQGNGTKNITGLKKGEYIISEDTNWSWRYSPQKSQTVNLNINNCSTKSSSVTFNNARVKDNWLSADNFVINIFKKRQGA